MEDPEGSKVIRSVDSLREKATGFAAVGADRDLVKSEGKKKKKL